MPRRGSIATREATTHVRHPTRSTTGILVHLLDDWVAHSLELLLHGLELLFLGMLSSVEPGHDLVDLVLNESVLELLIVDLVLHVVGVGLEAVLGIDPLLVLGILISELLGLTNHTLDVILAQTALVVGDGDVGFLARCRLVLSSHIEHTVGIDVKGDLNLGHATGGWGDASKLELPKEVVVLGAGALAFVDLDEHTWLVVSVGGESLRLLGGDCGVAGNQGGHDASSSLKTHRKWGNVEQQNVLVTSGAAWLLAVEIVGDQLLHLGDTGGATDEHNLVDGALVGLGILEHLLDWVEGATEEVGAEVLEASTGDGRVEVNALVQRVNLDLSVGG